MSLIWDGEKIIAKLSNHLLQNGLGLIYTGEHF